MKKILFITCLLLISIVCVTQNYVPKTTNMRDKTEEYKKLLENPQDTVIMDYSWRSKYFESPLYIKNKNYVVYQSLNTRKIIYPDLESFWVVPNMDESGIAADKNGVYFQGTLIETDTVGIQLVGRNNDYQNYHWLWKTKNKVFNNDKELTGIDAETFQTIECLNGQYFKDKNSVYYFDKKIEGSDGSSVSKSCGEVCYDKNHVYVNGEILTHNGIEVKPVNNILAKTDKEVIEISSQQVIPNIDAASLIKLSRNYSMDKNGVYYSGIKTPVQKENLANVRVWDQVNRAYVSDGVNVYSGKGESGFPENKLDAKTFGMLPHSDFVYDKDGVYERKWKDRINKLTLNKFPFQYTKPVSTQNTFITDNSRYIVYLNQAYDPWDKEYYRNLSDEKIQDLRNGGFISKDETNKLKEEEEFVSLGNYYSRKGDKIYMYREQLSEIEDADSFTPLNFEYSKDKKNVYMLTDIGYSPNKRRYTVEKLDGADPESLCVGILPYDKDYVYVGKEPLISSEDIEFLAIFCGYRHGCSMDRTPSSNYIFLKNKDGYWMLKTSYTLTDKDNLQYLGKDFNHKWNPRFEDFELAEIK